MSLSTVAKYISLTGEMTKLNILAAMEYRLSFLTQVFGMVINDAAFVVLWLVYFQKFPSLKGWTFDDSLLLLSFSTMSFSFVMVVARGAMELSRTITRGELDYFLSFPKSVLWHVSVSKTDISAIGDFVFGLIIFFFIKDSSLQKFLLIISLGILGALILLNFIIITQSIAFFVGNFENAAAQLFHSIVGFSLYPQSAFSGGLKLVMLTIIPAFFAMTVPVQLVRNFDLSYFFLMFGYWLVTSFAAAFIFKRGLKRYESGNLINVRM